MKSLTMNASSFCIKSTITRQKAGVIRFFTILILVAALVAKYYLLFAS